MGCRVATPRSLPTVRQQRHEPTERYASITDEKTPVSIAAMSMSRPVRAQ